MVSPQLVEAQAVDHRHCDQVRATIDYSPNQSPDPTGMALTLCVHVGCFSFFFICTHSVGDVVNFHLYHARFGLAWSTQVHTCAAYNWAKCATTLLNPSSSNMMLEPVVVNQKKNKFKAMQGDTIHVRLAAMVSHTRLPVWSPLPSHLSFSNFPISSVPIHKLRWLIVFLGQSAPQMWVLHLILTQSPQHLAKSLVGNSLIDLSYKQDHRYCTHLEKFATTRSDTLFSQSCSYLYE